MIRRSVLGLGFGAAWFAFVACNGSSGGDGNTGDTATPNGDAGVLVPQGIVGRVAVTSKATGATVTAFAADTGATLGTATVDDDGVFGIDVGSYTGRVRIETSGGTYVDPTSGETKPLPRFRSLTPTTSPDRPDCFAQLTPLSELAFALSETSGSWESGVSTAVVIAGGDDPICAKAEDPTVAPSGKDGVEAGIAIAGLTTFAAAKGTDLGAAIQNLATGIQAKSTETSEQYAAAVVSYLGATVNKSGLDAKSSSAASLSRNPWEYVTVPLALVSVAQCGKTYPKNPAFNYGGTTTVACADPKVTAAPVTAGPMPHPAGSRCGHTLTCKNDELHSCGGGYCIVAVVPPPSPVKLWKGCEWYTSRPSSPSCPGGADLKAPDQIVIPKGDDCNDGKCKPHLELVLPADHNIDGTLLMHRSGTYAAAIKYPMWYPGRPGFLDEKETCPGRADQGCSSTLHVTGTENAAPGTETITFLTTYGKQWTVTFQYSRAVNARTYCDIMSGKCVTYGAAAPSDTPPASGGSATCESLCTAIASDCGADAKCVRECTDDLAESSERNKRAEYEAMMQCCVGKSFAAHCDEDGFDPCQKGACERPW